MEPVSPVIGKATDNCHWAEHQDEYRTLPAYNHEGDAGGTTVSRWRPLFSERLRIALGAHVYLVRSTGWPPWANEQPARMFSRCPINERERVGIWPAPLASPAFWAGGPSGETVRTASTWRPTRFDRALILLGRDIWTAIELNGQPLQPMYLSLEWPEGL